MVFLRFHGKIAGRTPGGFHEKFWSNTGWNSMEKRLERLMKKELHVVITERLISEKKNTDEICNKHL